MTRQKTILMVIALALIGSTAGLLAHFKGSQKLGLPGVKVVPSSETGPDGIKVDVVLPEKLLDFTSEAVPIDKLVVDFLPQDTSYGQRIYRAEDGFEITVNVVLMGMDRTSLHKPQFCLTGQGWAIDDHVSSVVKIPIHRPIPYEMPVMKLVATKEVKIQDQMQTARGVYAYWFVSHEGLTASHTDRMLSMAKQMLTTGVLQRWAYVSCFSACAPTAEEYTFNRIKSFIAALVPELHTSAGSTGNPTNMAQTKAP
jgi:hypothetical protein